ncbi:transporter substrate-binding domain-containing protein [Pigmentibacter sp. JX0631]|uniref:substrate-binding periplasmic protein n=1 Tax=Pigmentibacter sp. JX0631 TaxID=2976982 RepID=UPI00246968A4|nr:transporter substrate-binding domain-containing protein [Pigmentibacter sp. JX0631]WGL60703.1 transporter substrate-binding domain-containing protein [Pigmentibacter sp. JX0631]
MRHFSLLVIIILLITWKTETFAKVLIINTQDWPPYQTTENEQVKGSATETLKCVLKKMKIDYSIKVLPWKLAQDQVKDNKADAFYSAGITSERNSYAIPTEKIANYKWIWVLNKNSNLDPLNPEFLKTATVAAKFGTGPEFYLYEKNYKVIASPKELIQLFEMLHAKRFDAFLTPEEPTQEVFNKKLVEKDNFKFVFHSNNALVFYFSKKYVKNNPNIIKQFNLALKNCPVI